MLIFVTFIEYIATDNSMNTSPCINMFKFELFLSYLPGVVRHMAWRLCPCISNSDWVTRLPEYGETSHDKTFLSGS